MSPNYKCNNALLFIALFFSSLFFLNAQVGINTTSPNGILEVNSDNTGVVLPRISLTSLISSSPLVNPQGGAIPAGTVVYNTNTTSTGTNDVTPGIYVWDGSKWDSQFEQKQYELFEQTTMNVRTSSNTGYETIPLSGSTFTAEYTGYYKVEINVNFGGGDAENPDPTSTSEGYLNVAAHTGTFRISLGANDYFIPAHSFSTSYYNGQSYFGIWKQFILIKYIRYTEGDSFSVSMAFDQDDAPEFEDDGNSYNFDGAFSGGDGHVGFDIPCRIEFTFLGDQ